jgi:AAA domain-containing protein
VSREQILRDAERAAYDLGESAMTADGAWYENAAALLVEPDPGPTPMLVDEIVGEAAITAIVGAPKYGKTFVMLDLSIAVATGEPALGRFDVSNAGPVLLILEESGRAALHRRLDKLARGRGIDPERLADLHFAANKRVRLDDDEWRQRLLEAARARDWRLIAFDPLVRVKGLVDENVQREIGPVLDFLRDLREESGATVAYVHHTPHDGTRHRGSSDLEAFWESKLTLAKTKTGGRTLQAEHREAEAVGPFALSFGFDATTGTLRLEADDDLAARVKAFVAKHPDASANDVVDALGGNRQRILDAVRILREGGSKAPEPPGTIPIGSDVGGGSPGGAYKAPGTTPLTKEPKVVPERQNHPDDKTCYRCGEPFRSGTGNKGDLCGKCVRDGFPGDEDIPF